MPESERFSGRRAGKSPAERSNFAQACTLLSQFLKEKRILSVGVSANSETKEKPETLLPSATTKNFLTNMETQAGVSSHQNAVVPPTVKPSDFVQKLVGFASEDSNKADPRKSSSTTVTAKPESSQMTIFYSGQVLVFNDLSADKANEVIGLARSGSSNVNGSVSVVSEPVVIEIIDLSQSGSPEPPNVVVPVSNNKSEININININSDISHKYNDNIINDNNNNKPKRSDRTTPQRPSEPANGSDLPIARRNSLHRFLEKRKDRVASKAPYQVPNRGAGGAAPGMAPPKPEEGSSKGGECSDQQLELKL